jgi:two-component system sensor histidine kinase/response regulator
MKFFCIVAWLMLLWFALPRKTFAQAGAISRLRTQLRTSGDDSNFTSDTAYVDTLNRLAHAFYGINADSAFFYARNAINFAEKTGYGRGESEGFRMLGNTYEMQGDYARMLDSYYRSLKVADSIGDNRLIAKANSNIALFYKQEGEYEEAQKIMEKVSESFKKSGDSAESSLVLADLSDLAYRRRQYSLALRLGEQALEAAGRMKDEPAVATYNNAIGKILAAQGDYPGALSHYQRSLAFYRESDEKLGLTSTTNLLAQVYLSQKDYPQALRYAGLSLGLSRQLHRKQEIHEAAKVLADIYEAKGDDRRALAYYKLYKDYSDSLFNDQSRKQVVAMAARYDFEKKESNLREDAAKKEALYQRRLRKDSQQISITVGVIVFLSLLAFILLRSRMVNRRNNQVLREKNEKIEEQKEALEHQAVQLLLNNQQKDKLFSIVAHDLRGPLNSLKGLLDFLKEKQLSEQEISGMLAELSRNVDSSSELVGNLLFWASSQLDGIVVKPVVMPLGPLVHDTLALFAHQAKEKKVELREAMDSAPEAYADKDMVQVVIRNLVSNAIKFCRPGDCVTIYSNRVGDEIEIRVADNGIGMKEDALERIRRRESFTSYGTAKEKGTGLGMLLCQEFTAANNGRFRVESEWGKGTCCYFTIPVAPSSSSISV